MDYEKFHQAVVLAYINLDGSPEKFGNEVINILNEFRENKQAAEHGVQADGACTCANIERPMVDKTGICFSCHQPRR